MTRHSFLATLFVLLPTLSYAQSYSGPIFDAHLHYNDDAVGHYSIGAVHELFSKNGVRAILANSRPNDGTRALVEAAQRGVRKDLKVVPFIRVYRNRDDYGTWFRNPEILAMIVEEEKRGYYRGVGEFHVFGKDADTKVLKDIVDFAVAKGMVLHAHCDEEALEILYRHNPKARQPWNLNENFSLAKSFRITESARVDLRWEMFNAFNRFRPNPGSTNVQDVNFGLVNSQLNEPRRMQLGLKIYW
jgi:hypothetical protein